MLKRVLAVAVGAASLTMFSGASANTFSISELLQVGASLPKIGDLASGSNLDASSGTITLNDGSQLLIRTKDGSPLSSAVGSNNTTLLADGREFSVRTSASSLEDAYNNSATPASFTVSAVVDSRVVSLDWDGPLDAVETESTFQARLNGQPVTFVLPEGTTLADFDGNTRFRLLDQNGNDLLEETTLNEVSADQINKLAAAIGALNADKSIAAAQRQAMVYNFGLIADQINHAMQPGSRLSQGPQSVDGTRFSFGQGLNAWVGSEIGNTSGDSAGMGYDADTKTAMFGVDARIDNMLAGVAVGYSNFDMTSNFGRSSLSGNLIAPYGAVALLDGNLVLDAILLYQDLDGSFDFGQPTDWSGDRWGARVAGTYYLPRFADDMLLAGLTAGAAYLNDDLDDSYGNDYGVELGEAFVGGRLIADFGLGSIWTSLTYFEEVSSDFDRNADLLGNDDDNRFEVKVGASHQLGTNMDFSIAAKTTVGSSDTDYDAVQMSLVYQF
ncbi:autotransporter outer membrane beta-barrel domain-containing protein [Halomonas mongoliensis]|uniref:autotransporter outer membrane beta-barrel domain-containing protein n=1 Tax=Halomonas mongoliensis TaxID=321265 RepID=UPI00403AF300